VLTHIVTNGQEYPCRNRRLTADLPAKSDAIYINGSLGAIAALKKQQRSQKAVLALET
jgi:hypothetical protein